MTSSAPSGWTFTNEPRLVPLSAYAQAQADFVKHFEAVRGVEAIYRFGSISFAGLSDLDFIVVLSDDFVNSPAVDFSILPFGADTQFVLYHPQFVCPKSLFADLEWLVPIFEFERIVGSPLERHAFSPEHEVVRKLFFLCQSITTDFAWSIFGFHQRKFVDVRMAQAKLNLVSKNLELIESLTGERLPATDAFKAAVRSLRSEWFELDSDTLHMRLVELLDEAQRVVAAIAAALDGYMRRWPGYETFRAPAGRWVYHYGESDIVFEDNIRALEASETARTGSRTLSVPSSLMIPLTWMCMGDGPASRAVRYHFDIAPTPARAMRDVEPPRMVALANQHCTFLKSKGIPTGNFNYFGYRSNFRPGVRTYLRQWTARLERAMSRDNSPPTAGRRSA